MKTIKQCSENRKLETIKSLISFSMFLTRFSTVLPNSFVNPELRLQHPFQDPLKDLLLAVFSNFRLHLF